MAGAGGAAGLVVLVLELIGLVPAAYKVAFYIAVVTRKTMILRPC